PGGMVLAERASMGVTGGDTGRSMPPSSPINPGLVSHWGSDSRRCTMSYVVVVLVEEPLADWDARQIVALHAEAPEPVRYHLLIPVKVAASRVESTIGSLAASEVMGTAAMYVDEADLERVHEEIREASRQALEQSLKAFTALGAQAQGEVTA